MSTPIYALRTLTRYQVREPVFPCWAWHATEKTWRFVVHPDELVVENTHWFSSATRPDVVPDESATIEDVAALEQEHGTFPVPTLDADEALRAAKASWPRTDAAFNAPRLWCAACGKWGDHGSGTCPTIYHKG